MRDLKLAIKQRPGVPSQCQALSLHRNPSLLPAQNRDLATPTQRATDLLGHQRQHDGAVQLRVGAAGAALPFSARALGEQRHDLHLGGRRLTVTVYQHGDRYAVFTPAGSALLADHDPLAEAGAGAAAAGRLTAPMPGKVVGCLARAGDKVQRGQALAVMEAMKMEHTITAPHDGVVEELLYAVGDQVVEGSELLRLAKA